MMLAGLGQVLLGCVWALGQRTHSDERGQDAFEYLLVIGGVSTLVLATMIFPSGTLVVDSLFDGVCSAVKGVVGIESDSC